MIRAVLFDAAGTLIELIEPVGETYSRHAARQGVEIAPWRLTDAFRRAFGQTPMPVVPETQARERLASERAWWRDVVRRTFLAAASDQRVPDFEALFDGLWAAFSSAEHWSPRAGAPELLDRIRDAGLQSAVVSNFDSRLMALLRDLDIAQRVDAIVLASDAGAAKPAPEIFRYALRQLRVSADEALFIGDDPERDLAGARAAGLLAIDVAPLATLVDLQLPESRA